jgi:IS30 family transposase
MKKDYYSMGGQMDVSDRLAIEVGICSKQSFKKIAELLKRHPSTIAREVKENRTFVKGYYPNNIDCKNTSICAERYLCGSKSCHKKCRLCNEYRCTELCSRYQTRKCETHNKPPYVCNTCPKRKVCSNDRYYYSARFAQEVSDRRRSESRMGITISDEEKEKLDLLLTTLVKKGQPLTHIYSEHGDEMPVSLRTLYNYIDRKELTIRNVDLRRKTGYRPRKKKYKDIRGFYKGRASKREGRSYKDFENYYKGKLTDDVVEMDTVKGVRETGKRLLTMIFRKNNVMLLFLMPDGKAESVIRIFDYLEIGLGTEVFKRLFPTILTDNGSEFIKVEALEVNSENEPRTKVFFCDPMASWQKGCIEKNHEYIRYALPKGKSFNAYDQEDMTLLMNHINSVKRPSIGGKCPYELVDDTDDDFRALMGLLKMHLIPPDEVHLMPDLFIRK